MSINLGWSSSLELDGNATHLNIKFTIFTDNYITQCHTAGFNQVQR